MGIGSADIDYSFLRTVCAACGLYRPTPVVCNNLSPCGDSFSMNSFLCKSKLLAIATMVLLLACICVLPSLAVYNMVNRLQEWSDTSHTNLENGYQTGIAENVRYHGKASAFIKATRVNQPISDYYLTMWQVFKAKKYRGKRFEFSGVVKTENTKGGITPFVKVKQDDEVLRFNNSVHIKQSGSWKKFSIAMDVPPKSTSIGIGFYITGGGTIWINNLAVKEVSDSTKVTNITWDAKKFHAYSWELVSKIGNPNFTDLSPQATPKAVRGWATNCRDSRDYDFGVDQEMQRQGLPSAYIVSKTDNGRDFALVFNDLSATDYVGKRMKLSAFLKTQDVADWAAIFMRVDGVNKVLGFDNMEDRPVKGTQDWKEYSVVLDVPKEAKQLRVGAMLAGNGKVWINSVKFEPAAPDTPVTQKPIDLTRVIQDTTPDAPTLELQLK